MSHEEDVNTVTRTKIVKCVYNVMLNKMVSKNHTELGQYKCIPQMDNFVEIKTTNIVTYL